MQTKPAENVASTARGVMLLIKSDGETEATNLTSKVELEMLQKNVGGFIEHVPGFDTIIINGKHRDCSVFCNEEGKLHGLPFNSLATHFWDLALTSKGHSLKAEDGSYHDILVGDIVVIYGNKQLMRTL